VKTLLNIRNTNKVFAQKDHKGHFDLSVIFFLKSQGRYSSALKILKICAFTSAVLSISTDDQQKASAKSLKEVSYLFSLN